MKGRYSEKEREGVNGFLRRYFDTKRYCRDYKESGGDLSDIERHFYRDRNIVRGVTIPLALGISAASYFTPSSQEWTKVIGHATKGYASSMLGQMIAEGKIKGLGKYGIGLGASSLCALGWEAMQNAGIVSGNFNIDDMGYDLIGGLGGVAVENFFDRKLQKVSDFDYEL